MDALTLKLILIALMFALSAAFGLTPIKVLQYLRKRAASTDMMEQKWPSMILCLLSCFTGGVFLGACFLHLLPDVADGMDKVRAAFNWDVQYPVAELISCLGFFLVFLVEELVLLCFHSSNHHNNGQSCHGNEHNAVHVCVTDNHHHHDHNPNHSGNQGSGEHRNLVTAKMKLNDVTSHPENCPGIEMTSTAEPECCEGPCEGRDEDPPILMGYRPHAHSHGVRSATLVLALSFHSVIEGLALGVQSSPDSMAKLFLTIIIHKCVVLFGTGVQLARTHAHSLKVVVACILLLSSMSPLGAVLGVALEQSSLNSNLKDAVVMVLEGLSVGTFLYVTFFEVLVHERDNEHNNLLKLLATIFGFAMIAALAALGHGHSHGPDHTEHGHHRHHSSLNDSAHFQGHAPFESLISNSTDWL